MNNQETARPAVVRPRFVPFPYQEGAEAGEVILRDGSSAILRASAPEDQSAMQNFFERLTLESRRQRFFTASLPRAELIASLCDNSRPRSAFTLIVLRTRENEARIVATASYFAQEDSNSPNDQDSAEVAFAVDDHFQGMGLGSILLERLAILAVRWGFKRFWAVTHADNRAMREVFRESGFDVQEKAAGETMEVELAVKPTEKTLARLELRDRLATTASLAPFFRPRAVAVVGASRDPASIGYRILEALIQNHFQGAVYPVNPKAAVISCIRAYPSVRDLPEPVDLAVIAVPKEAVLQVVDECAARGVRALVVITAGFAEVSGEGKSFQTKLRDKVRGHGMRMVGPNCMGLLNTDPAIRLNASFSPVFPPPGRVAMSSQSGALGLAILSYARNINLGLSTFVSVGNKADVSANDLLQYWEEDAGTDVILLYLESFGNPRRFARIARRVSERKPIVALKSGRSQAGGRAASSHTAALATSDAPVDALFRQTGVIRADTLEEMFDLASLLIRQPIPRGRRVAIVTNAGGPGILCADACEASGLLIPELSLASQARLAKLLPPAASVVNPIDMIASAGPEQYRHVVETLLVSREVDALVAIYIPAGLADTSAACAALAQAVAAARQSGAGDIPVLACLMAEGSAAGSSSPTADLEREKIPTFVFPEAAARALAKVAAYADWRSQPRGVILEYADQDIPAVQEICQRALAQHGPGWLSVGDAMAVLHAAALPGIPGGIAQTPHEAVRLAEQVGFPVCLKLASRMFVHKTEVGGVRLDLQNAAAVCRAFEEIHAAVVEKGGADAMEGALVQPMLSGGVEVMVGVTQDRLFGAVMAFGLGGIHVEVLGDVCFRVTPLTDRDAEDMVRSIKGYRLLKGYRGHPPADVDALQELLLRVSRLVEDVPEIKELDLNPIFAMPPGEGCRLVDARIMIG